VSIKKISRAIPEKRIEVRFLPELPSKLALFAFQVQKEAYQREARLIGFERLPPLVETFQDFLEKPEHWVSAHFGSEFRGGLAYEVGANKISISKLFVCPKHFRETIGRTLLTSLLNRFKQMAFEVQTAQRNHPALKLYASCGFRETNRFLSKEGLELIKLHRPAIAA
jgi:GNAT superfamily N-acetyltransferase